MCVIYQTLADRRGTLGYPGHLLGIPVRLCQPHIDSVRSTLTGMPALYGGVAWLTWKLGWTAFRRRKSWYICRQ